MANYEQALRFNIRHGMGGVIFTDDTNYKTGQPIMEVLKEKHLALITPGLSNLACTPFEYYKEDPDVIPLDILE